MCCSVSSSWNKNVKYSHNLKYIPALSTQCIGLILRIDPLHWPPSFKKRTRVKGCHWLSSMRSAYTRALSIVWHQRWQPTRRGLLTCVLSQIDTHDRFKLSTLLNRLRNALIFLPILYLLFTFKKVLFPNAKILFHAWCGAPRSNSVLWCTHFQ